MKKTLFPLLLLCFSISGCTAQQASGYDTSNSDVKSPPPNSTQFRTAVLKEVNALRQKGCRCGAQKFRPTHPLKWNELLTEAAKRHALDIAGRRQLDHTGRDGSSVMTRTTDTGYNWQSVAENIAYGYWDIPSVIQGWVESKGHCKNMMNPDYKEVAVYRKDNYWVMVLATHL